MNFTTTLKASGPLFSRGQEAVQQQMDALVTEAVVFLQREIKERVPQGVYGAQGGLLGSILHEVTGQGTNMVRGVVGTAQAYGEVIERGRRPGKYPPKGSLLRWIEIKFGIDPREATRLEFLIRRKIAKKGTKGAAMFYRGMMENLTQLEAMGNRHGIELKVGLGDK